ncbi:MAG: hypothetical protein LC118_05330 [Dehalococcoidia bacterium]|nr:hypothetical protein [Dehalococcoidia bacterium]
MARLQVRWDDLSGVKAESGRSSLSAGALAALEIREAELAKELREGS